MTFNKKLLRLKLNSESPAFYWPWTQRKFLGENYSYLKALVIFKSLEHAHSDSPYASNDYHDRQRHTVKIHPSSYIAV